MEGFTKLVADGGLPAYIIILMGLAGFALVVERVKALFFDYNLKADEFVSQIRSLILNDKVDEAITLSAANEKMPLPHVIKSVLERSDRDDQAIQQSFEIAMTEVMPDITKRLGYLSMLANVATLTGLLGTISGLIMAFSAVSFADPSQKQAILAQGISMAMNTTALGLGVAIPIMIAYAFLNARQNHLLEQATEYGAKIVDLLTTRHYQPFATPTVFPSTLGKSELEAKNKSEPPTASAKIS